MFKKGYANVFKGDANWAAIKTPAGKIYSWDGKSTYVKNPPYFDGMTMTPAPLGDIKGARALAVLGDSVTTDHISPAGNISKSSPAAKYLLAQGVQVVDFNSYGARRGNHEVMMRGTFANIRLRNLLLPGTEGGVTLHIPSGEQMSIFDASVKYKAAGTPLVILAGKEYGTGSSRDWAAKGTMLLGVKAVIAESFERIHRSNLIGMGVLPLQYKHGRQRAKPRAHRQGNLRNRGAEPRRGEDRQSHRQGRRWQNHRIRGAPAHRYSEGTRLLPARRNPAIRVAAARGAQEGGMTSLSMYQATVPTCTRALNSLAAILEKAAGYAESRKIDTAVLLQTRLYPDMLPLSTQIYIANDIAAGGAARLAGAPVPAFDGKDKTLAELIANTRRTVEYLATLKPQQFEGSEDRTINWQTRTSTKSMQGMPYLLGHVLPNVFFHVTTAYNILRQAGLDIGKQDYLGSG